MSDQDVMTPRLAITGPTAAGKSRLCSLLVQRGAMLVDADAVGHGLLDEPEVQARIVDAFGVGILDERGRIDRKVLGPRVFATPERRQELDAIVHPPLAEACTARLAEAVAAKAPLVILEAAVYFLLPGPPPVDMTVTITAPRDVRLARLIALGLSPERAHARIDGQAHLEPFWALARCIIDNDGSAAALTEAANQIWRDHAAPTTLGG